MSRPSLGRGMVPSVGMDPLGYFVTLWLIPGCALGQLEASMLGGKMSSPYGKVR